MSRLFALTLLPLAACIDYKVVPKDLDTAIGRDDSPCSGCDDTGTPDTDPPDTDPPDTDPPDTGPEDCTVAIPGASVVQVQPECAGAGTPQPVNDPWNVQVEWQWTGLSTDPLVREVAMAPMVGNLTDDNGDGRINEDDSPEIVFIASIEPDFYNGTLVVLDGATGAELWSRSGFDSWGGLALADIDGDNRTDIVLYSRSERVVALDATGSQLWASRESPSSVYPQVTVADLEGDGAVEVIADTLILDGRTGASLARLPVDTQIPFGMTAVGDLDLDGVQELITGNTVTDPSGAILWSTSVRGFSGHWSAIVQADSDPEAEVMMIGTAAAGLYEHDGTPIQLFYSSANIAGPPCAADFDGDGDMDIAWVWDGALNMMGPDGALRWSTPIDDASGAAACSGFDFDGDGVQELLFAGEDSLRILDGRTGETHYLNTEHASATIFEYPVVADVDADGTAEIVLASNSYDASGWSGITVLGHAGDGWPRTGTTWPIHDFATTNINPDGTVPPSPVPWWQDLKVYRARPGVDTTRYPDLEIAVHDLCVASCDTGPVRIALQAQNHGGRDIDAGVPWAFYKNDGGTLTFITSGLLPAVPSGAAPEGFEIAVLPTDIGADGFVIAVDDDGSGLGHLYECDESNNLAIWGDSVCSS